MTYRRYEGRPAPDRVRRLTFVLFLPDGACAAVPDPAGGPALPSGAVRDGEHWLLDTSLRVPLQAAGFRRQRVHVFAIDGNHAYAWLDGDRYRGRRPHAQVDLLTGPPARIAGQLAAAGRPDQAQAVRDAARSYDGQSEQDYYEDNVRLLEPAYLRGGTPQEQSGFGGGPDRWRARLPHWADRIEVGNAIGYRPAGGRRFTFVHAMLDTVPAGLRAELVRHALAELVAPGGRLLVSHYQGEGGTDRTAPQHLAALGFRVAGSSHARDQPRTATTAWLTAP